MHPKRGGSLLDVQAGTYPEFNQGVHMDSEVKLGRKRSVN